jgi:hypothetical protein
MRIRAMGKKGRRILRVAAGLFCKYSQAAGDRVVVKNIYPFRHISTCGVPLVPGRNCRWNALSVKLGDAILSTEAPFYESDSVLQSSKAQARSSQREN